MKKKHTPTPWINHDATIDAKHGGEWREILAPNRDDTIATLTPDRLSHPDAPEWSVDEIRANAEFIVRACNSYDDLMATAQQLVHVLERLPIVDPLISDAHTACKKARAAIAAATE